MRHLVFAIGAAILAASATSAVAQEKKKDDRPVIVVTGCVDGSWLLVKRADPVGSYAERYKLRGAKSLLKEIEKEYKNHLLEVTGAVTDVGDTSHRGKTINIGKKTRITTGAKEVPERPSGAGDPLLEIASFRDLKDSCK